MNRDRRASTIVAECALILLLVATLWGYRTMLGVGWGIPRLQLDGRMTVGFLENPHDNYVYMSWVQQAWLGANSFSDLYTTTPHETFFFAAPLWAFGRMAQWLNVNPFVAYHAAGLMAAPMALWFVFRAARAWGWSATAAFWSAFVVGFGSGGSWLVQIGNKLFGTTWPWGADMSFFDFLPSATFHLYPYHAVSYALIAGLLWFAGEAERRLLAGEWRGSIRWLTGVTAAAFLLAWSRPYEPVAFFLVYTMYAAVGWPGPRENRRGVARRTVGLALGLGLAPGLAQTVWISLHPVWSGFAHGALENPRSRIYWLTGFGFLWLLAGIGAWLSRTRMPARATFLTIWSGFCFILLVVVNSQWTKLASGGFIALALLSGLAIEQGASWLRQRLPRWAAFPTVAVGVTVLAGVPSLAMELRMFPLRAESVDAELVADVGIIRRETMKRFPLVLTDALTGNKLPGLGGFRVYAMRSSLSDGDSERNDLLLAAGIFSEADPYAPKAANRDASALPKLLAEARFDFALLNNGCAAAIGQLGKAGWRVLHRGEGWTLLAAPT